MSDLRNFVGRTTSKGTRANIWLQVMVYINVGSGQFTELTDKKMAFNGKVEAALYRGDVSFTLVLGEKGVAEVFINGRQAEKATYEEDGKRMAIEARLGSRNLNVLLERGGKSGEETFISVSGSIGASVHLVPVPGASSVA